MFEDYFSYIKYEWNQFHELIFLVYLKLVNNRKFLLEKMNRSVTKIKKKFVLF